MRAKRLIAFVLPLFAAGLGILAYVLAARDPGQVHATMTLLAFSVAMAAMYIGCAMLFLLGLKNFTAQLKIAYGVFCGGLIFFALGELQVPVLTLVAGAGSSWLGGAGLLVPILLGVGGIYTGIKLFANLFSVESWWGKPWFVLAIALAAAVGAYMLPVGPAIVSAEQAKGSDSLMAIMFVLFVATAVLCYRIKQRASASYQSAMQWFLLTQVSFVVIAIITAGTIILLGSSHWFIAGGYTILLQAVFALLLVKAAYEFNTIGEVETQTPEPAVTDQPPQVEVVDIVVAAAQKASDITAIDPLLEDMRVITSKVYIGENMTSDDEAQLVRTYQRLEDYLATNEPVRRYTKQELRERLRHELHITGPAFFDTLP